MLLYRENLIIPFSHLNSCVFGVAAAGPFYRRCYGWHLLQRCHLCQPWRGSALRERRGGKKCSSWNFYNLKKILLLRILLPSGERGAGALGGAWSLGAGGQNGWCRRQGSGQGPDLLPPASIWTTPLGAPHGGLLWFLSCWIRTIFLSFCCGSANFFVLLFFHSSFIFFII